MFNVISITLCEVTSVLDKKKRRSESLSGDSSDKVSVSDNEYKTTREIQAFSAEALLEQVFHTILLLLLYEKSYLDFLLSFASLF